MGKYRFGNNLQRSASGRFAGDGIIEDRYDEMSGGKRYEKMFDKVRFPNDKRKPESLNGPVIIVQKAKTKAERCVCCDEVIPEGRQVCPKCERRV